MKTLRERCIDALTAQPQAAVVIADAIADPLEQPRVQPMLNRLVHAGLAMVTYRGRGLRRRAFYTRANAAIAYCYEVAWAAGAGLASLGSMQTFDKWMGSMVRREYRDDRGAVVGHCLLRYTGKQQTVAA